MIDLTWHCWSPMRAVGEHCFAIGCVSLAGHGEGGAVEGSNAHDVGRVHVGTRGSGCMYGVSRRNRQVELQEDKQLAVAQDVAQRADYSAGTRGSASAGIQRRRRQHAAAAAAAAHVKAGTDRRTEATR